jgi:hypothetical protein
MSQRVAVLKGLDLAKKHEVFRKRNIIILMQRSKVVAYPGLDLPQVSTRLNSVN